ncbi:MBL fold metallo-hydrolase (plasmid) [Enterobacter sp. JBIWA003]|uniref:MBL fold metallo-hydrolase n=1 Tax=Enterobacter sp. JBIWA003 TaxID=2831890 RepID=UPI001CBC3970|nr:MBL fold metallo-hydrolase [Enterobacter sp. JBIWA003]UAN24749.1 MBL fold metallo-hydrolase [Enterobacter sp. JBIWA003]
MKLTILVDNNTFIDEYLIGEPGVSYYIECDELKILFDVGYSDVFIKNAQLLSIDLTSIDKIVFSHGHNDHTWGLNHLIQYYDRTIKKNKRKIDIIAHPAALIPKYFEAKPIGMNHRQDEKEYFFKIVSTIEPLKMSEHITFLGQIPRVNKFEAQKSVGHTCGVNGKLTDDFVLDDSALVIETEKGLIIITGCSHAGICNIIEYAKKVTGVSQINSVIGGFHLMNADSKLLDETGKYLKSLSAKALYPCHCTDLTAKIHLSRYVDIKEVGVGLSVDFPVR